MHNTLHNKTAPLAENFQDFFDLTQLLKKVNKVISV